ncbi:hypothetical protein A2U01_0086961, partial [Trifolium medium]|nr:hypothetical protein [Trifolium medium]
MFDVFEGMKRYDEEEPQCYRVDVIEVEGDKGKVQSSSPTVEGVVVNSLDVQKAEWSDE